MSSEGSKICVVIRKRPLNKKEIANNQADVVTVKNGETVIVSQQKVDLTKYIEESAFNFDYAFGDECNNQEIYCTAVRPLIESAFMGARVTCFAYGQTGSGKTFTMNGVSKQGIPGLYTLGAQDIFEYRNSFNHLKVTVSFFEIYCGKLFDLLNTRAELAIRQDNKQNIHIVGLKQEAITAPQDFMKILEYGSNFRVTSQNSTNADSSRSHAILQICLKQGKKIFGKISFIDLAGCQRGADHMDQNKQTRIDGAEINKSLLSLKQCIRALDQGKGHTPFRGSKLTMVLKDSFVGFCRTVMIGNISPNITSCQNTLNTLRYADRVKQLKKGGNQPMSKQDKLAKELMLPRNGKNAVQIMIDNDDDAEDIMKKKNDARVQLGIRNQSKMMVQQPLNRPKNNTFTDKPGKKNVQNNTGSVNKNETGLFDNCKTIQMRPKQNSLFNQPSQAFQNNQQPSHPYGNKNSIKTNNFTSQNSNNNVAQNNNQPHFNRATSLHQNIYQNNNNKNLFGNRQQVKQYNQPQYNPQNYQQNQQQLFRNNTSQQYNNQYQNNNNQYQNNNQYEPQMNSKQTPSRQSVAQSFDFQSYQNQNGKRNSYQNQNGFQFQNNNQFQNNQYQNQRQQQSSQYSQSSYQSNSNQIFPQQYQPEHDQQLQYEQPNQFQRQYQSQQRSQQNMFDQKSFPNNTNMFQKPTQPQQFMEQQIKDERQPFEWSSTIDLFRNWKPNNNLADLKYFRDAHQFMIQKLVQEEDSMTSEHSQTINRQIQTIKGQMRFIQDIQKNKAMHESIEYAQFIEDMIDRKLSALVRLKKRVNNFKQHLSEHQQCQQKLFMAQELVNGNPDDFLLDDLESEY